MESSDQGKIKHEAASKGGLALVVFLLYTVVLAHCFIRANALHNWRGGCCSGKVSLDLFSSALSSRCKLEQRQVLPAEWCEPNRQMSLLALEKSRTLELSWERLLSLPGTHPCTAGKHQQEKLGIQCSVRKNTQTLKSFTFKCFQSCTLSCLWSGLPINEIH